MPQTRTNEANLNDLAQAVLVSEELARLTTPDLEITTCPGWSAEDLWHHLGSVHRWAARIVQSKSTERQRRSEMGIELPEVDRLAEWIAEGGAGLIEALDTDPDTPVWSWAGVVPTHWWVRRQLHETLMHNADAAIALGDPVDIAQDLAEDCLDEYLEVNAAALKLHRELPADSLTVHLHATDMEEPDSGEWMVQVDSGTISHTREHGKGDAAVRAPVVDLLLLITNRRDLDEIEAEVFGDTGALDRLKDLVTL